VDRATFIINVDVEVKYDLYWKGRSSWEGDIIITTRWHYQFDRTMDLDCV